MYHSMDLADNKHSVFYQIIMRVYDDEQSL